METSLGLESRSGRLLLLKLNRVNLIYQPINFPYHIAKRMAHILQLIPCLHRSMHLKITTANVYQIFVKVQYRHHGYLRQYDECYQNYRHT